MRSHLIPAVGSLRTLLVLWPLLNEHTTMNGDYGRDRYYGATPEIVCFRFDFLRSTSPQNGLARCAIGRFESIVVRKLAARPRMPPGIATNLRKVFPMGLVRPECRDRMIINVSRDGTSSVENLLLISPHSYPFVDCYLGFCGLDVCQPLDCSG